MTSGCGNGTVRAEKARLDAIADGLRENRQALDTLREADALLSNPISRRLAEGWYPSTTDKETGEPVHDRHVLIWVRSYERIIRDLTRQIRRESVQHLPSHGPCRPGEFGDPHEFEHVPGSDALSRCSKCVWVIGK